MIAIELATGLCAGAFFDLVPTVWHLLLVAFVPACNALLWRAVQGSDQPHAWLVLAGGAAACAAASYTLLFLLILPVAGSP